MEKTMASLQAFLSFLHRAPHALSRAQIFPPPFNACQAGYDCNVFVTCSRYLFWTLARASHKVHAAPTKKKKLNNGFFPNGGRM